MAALVNCAAHSGVCCHRWSSPHVGSLVSMANAPAIGRDPSGGGERPIDQCPAVPIELLISCSRRWLRCNIPAQRQNSQCPAAVLASRRRQAAGWGASLGRRRPPPSWTYGTRRARGLLDAVIGAAAERLPQAIDPVLLGPCCGSAPTQLLRTRVDAHAAVSATASKAGIEFDSARAGFAQRCHYERSPAETSGPAGEPAPDAQNDPIGHAAPVHMRIPDGSPGLC